MDAGLRVAVDDVGQNVGEIGLGINCVELGCLNQRGGDGPVLTVAIGAGEESILAIESNGPDCALDDVGVDLDAAVVDEPG